MAEKCACGDPYAHTKSCPAYVSQEGYLLVEAHEVLHRLLGAFVPGNDGAHAEVVSLMRRIRESLPNVEFQDDGPAGVQTPDGGQR